MFKILDKIRHLTMQNETLKKDAASFLEEHLLCEIGYATFIARVGGCRKCKRIYNMAFHADFFFLARQPLGWMVNSTYDERTAQRRCITKSCVHFLFLLPGKLYS